MVKITRVPALKKSINQHKTESTQHSNSLPRGRKSRFSQEERPSQALRKRKACCTYSGADMLQGGAAGRHGRQREVQHMQVIRFRNPQETELAVSEVCIPLTEKALKNEPHNLQ